MLPLLFPRRVDGLEPVGLYTYSSGGTTLITEVLDGTVDNVGNVIVDFSVKEGTSQRATFKLNGKASSFPPAISNEISGDPLPEANSGFAPILLS